MMDILSFLLRCLDEIEQRECRLLVWGVVDSAFTLSELQEIIDPILDDAIRNGYYEFSDSEEIVQSIYERGLVHQFNRRGQTCYRSRMAETVRLLSRLRQLFPQHRGDTGWQSAPTLVADYRFACRKRKFPRRDISAESFLNQLADLRGANKYTEPLTNLLRRNGGFLQVSGFQAKGTIRILEGLIKGDSRGTIVSAGTGSGKTLAFYLPALSHVSNRIVQDSLDLRCAKVLAIYPRNELLKDQFSEVYEHARRLDNYLLSRGKRKIQIAAFFGQAPQKSDSVLSGYSKWHRSSGGYVCEYLRCPNSTCNGKMIWLDEDRTINKEQLRCNRCGYMISQDEIVLTRERMIKNPPDIIFTTTEMLNQRMSDTSQRHLFGLGQNAKRPPDIVLLDETHTYSGLHGAQVAYLLRRWRHLIKRNVSFVGLSATLQDAAKFFATLTGLNEWQVAQVTPTVGELEAQGSEYMIALRGDPVSRRSLLSTTIQTAMLATRAMDPLNRESGSLFGSKLFVFTDDIDVTNRLYFNLLDAEGRDSWGRPDLVHHREGGLAVLRRSSLNEIRYEYGQDWRMCERLGHDLSSRATIGRTSSQDTGVDSNANIIVATAALEVGFNDPKVGSVIQHKAPRDMAQFLQRKGRAGRLPSMRPWTIVILSDYGRDRLFYQGYDQLFDPELTPRYLPTKNRYVMRMQSVYALMDYLSSRLTLSQAGSVWRDLSGPNNHSKRRKYVADELLRLLESEQARDEFSDYLENALRVDSQEVLSLLWEYPRPLLTTVLPTALRRLETNWRKGENGMEYCINNSPLPEFIPPNLFTDLNLPEVHIDLPEQTSPELTTTMPVFQAMKEFAPGRVSRRFGIAHKYERHWVAPIVVSSDSLQSIELESFGDFEYIGEFTCIESAGQGSVPVYRPLVLRPQQTESTINDTSNAFLVWRSEIVPCEEGRASIDVPQNSGWEEIIKEIAFCMHNHRTQTEVRRFALESKASIFRKDGSIDDVSFFFHSSGKQTAIGYVLAVDGVVFKVKIPTALWLDSSGYRSMKWQALRTGRYFDAAWQGEYLSSVPSPFTRNWIAQVYLSALTHEAISTKDSLSSAALRIHNGQSVLQLADVLEVIFQSIDISSVNEGPHEALYQDLANHLRNPQILEQLERLGLYLWSPIDASWQSWLSRRYLATLAAAISDALRRLCPDLDSDSLIVDIDFEGASQSELEEIWFTENTVGGCGIIEQLIGGIGEDPRRFFGLIDAALQPSELEFTDEQLLRFLELMNEPTATAESATVYRSAVTAREFEKAFEGLRQTLINEGFVLFHSFLAGLNNRILRPGSSPMSDLFLLKSIQFWMEEERRLGVEIDSRVMAYVLSEKDDVEGAVPHFMSGQVLTNIRQWRFNAIYGLLWQRGSAIRQAGLSIYNPFSDFPKTERLLVAESVLIEVPVVNTDAVDWQSNCLSLLSKNALVRLVCPRPDKDRLKVVFGFLMTNPAEDNYLLLYPRIRGVRQFIDRTEVDVELVEALQ